MKVEISMDYKEFNEKPQGQDIGAITNRIASHKQTIDLKELALELTKNGKTVMLATYHSKPSINNELDQQQILMLDFDNNDLDNQLSFNKAINNEFIMKHACFAYKTFSDSQSELDKFRVAFVLNQPFLNNDSIAKAYYLLLKLFPQADRVTTNPNRLFFGSCSGYTEINFNNRLPNEWVLEQYADLVLENDRQHRYIGSLDTKNEPIDNQLVYELLKNKEYETVREIIQIKYKETNLLNNQFKSESSVHNFFKTELDLIEFLDLPDTNNFCCILTNENNPSASIYLANSNIQLYNNFATGYKADIVKLVAELTGKTTFEAVELLMYLTDSKLIENTTIQRQIRAVDYLIECLGDPDLKDTFPNTHKFFNRNMLEIVTILKLISSYKYIDSNGTIQIMSYLTLDTITRQVENRVKFKVTKATVTKCLSLLALTEVIIKKSIEQVNNDMISTIDLTRNELGIQYQRYPNFITINEFSDLNYIEQVFADLDSKKFTLAGGLNFEWLYTNYSTEIALKVFPQKYTSTKAKDITDSLVINNESQDKIERIMAILNTYYLNNDTNYIKNSTLTELLKQAKFPKVEKNLSKYRNIVVSEFENYYSKKLFLQKGTKELKEQLNIPHSERITGYVFYFKT